MKNLFKSQIKQAFTLAEVLITLGIIGVVASITIPALMNNIQDRELKTAWKKQYSIFSQATQTLFADNGEMSFKSITSDYNHNTLRDYYLSNIKYLKKCNTNSTFGYCWHQHTVGGNGVTKYLNGGDINDNALPLGAGSAGAILADGAYVLFAYQDSTCTSKHQLPPSPDYENLTNACGWITIDVNGAKNPNLVGKDIFGMFILENKIVPMGTSAYSNTCISSGNGLGCAAKYLME